MAKIAVIGICGNSIFMYADHFHEKGETLVADSVFEEIGGKGINQAVAAARMGAEVSFLSAIGDDKEGQACIDVAKNENINDIKNGMTIILDGQLYQIVDFLHVKPGKGSAFMKTKLKNLRTGGTVERTFNTNVKFEKANIEKSNVQYLYNTGDTYNFMNMESYEQLELTADQLGDDKNYLIENMTVMVK